MPNPTPSPRRGATTAQLRADIDRGLTGDKVAAIDPAASPLGTDDEAGGVPPTPETVATARAAERRPETRGARSTEPRTAAPDGRPKQGRGVMWIGLAAGSAAAAVLGAVYAWLLHA